LTECAYFITVYHHCYTVDAGALNMLLIQLCRKAEDLGLCQIIDDRIAHQWFMINALFKKTSGTSLEFIERTLQEKWAAMTLDVKSSQFEDEVAECLSRLGIRFERQKIINAIPVDFYLTDYDSVLEANGPSHYLFGFGEPLLTPRDIARNKLVGIKLKSPVIIVSYFEWAVWQEDESCDKQLQLLVNRSDNSETDLTCKNI